MTILYLSSRLPVRIIRASTMIFLFFYFTVVALSLVVRGICYSAFSDWAGSYYPVFAGRYPWELYF